jgi:chromosome segregation ATPase
MPPILTLVVGVIVALVAIILYNVLNPNPTYNSVSARTVTVRAAPHGSSDATNLDYVSGRLAAERAHNNAYAADRAANVERTLRATLLGDASDLQSLSSRQAADRAAQLTLGQAVTETRSAVVGLRTELDAAAHSLADARRDTTLAQDSIAAVRADLMSVSGTVSSAQTTLTSVANVTDQVRGSLAANLPVLAQLGARMGQAEADIHGAQTDLTEVRSDVNQAATTIASIQATVTTATAATSQAATDILGLRSDLTDLQKGIVEIQKNPTDTDLIESITARLSNDITDAKTRLADVTTDVGTLKTATAQLNGLATTATTRLDNADEDIRDAKTRLTTAEGTIAASSSAIGGLQSSTATAANRLTTAESRIAQAQTNMTTISGQINHANSRISTAETSLGDVQTRVATAEGSISTAQTSLTTLGSSVQTAHTRLTATEATATAASAVAALAKGVSTLHIGDVLAQLTPLPKASFVGAAGTYVMSALKKGERHVYIQMGTTSDQCAIVYSPPAGVWSVVSITTEGPATFDASANPGAYFWSDVESDTPNADLDLEGSSWTDAGWQLRFGYYLGIPAGQPMVMWKDADTPAVLSI